ncbi:MAG: HRDC domain-containing protein [Opitutales bacterium]
MITTTDALADAVHRAREAGAVGVDTEFVWVRSYYPKLGVVQIGYPDGGAELIDAPEIEDWSPLAELMSDPETVKIFHDAQQDLNILHRACGALPKNIFDTQRTAGFVGLSSTISLSELLKSLLRVRLNKSETRSDWTARPLSEAQIKYAKEDVIHSVDLMTKIMNKAEKLGRADWIRDEMRMYEDESLYGERDPDAEMPRVRGSGALTRQQRDMLRALGSWREHKARRRNLPRHFVLSDEAVISLVKRPPAKPEDIRPMKGLSERNANRNRGAIWEAIERGLSGELPELPNNKHNGPQPDDGYEARVDLALAFVKGTCLAARIDPALIGNRAEITAFILEIDNACPTRHRLLSGWRGDFCGKALHGLLQGEGSVAVDPETKLPKLSR